DDLRINCSYAEQIFDFAFRYQHSVLKRMLNEPYTLTKLQKPVDIGSFDQDNPIIKVLSTDDTLKEKYLTNLNNINHLCEVKFFDANEKVIGTELLAPSYRDSSVGEGRGQLLFDADNFALQQNSEGNNIRSPNDFKKAFDKQMFNTIRRSESRPGAHVEEDGRREEYGA
ncbi:hypothetical protein RCN09_12485, partial [Escherichia marmotae]|nr:hypothetical protein [Escherichia marmotae]